MYKKHYNVAVPEWWYDEESFYDKNHKRENDLTWDDWKELIGDEYENS
jgi:hypothetical protein